MAYHSRRTRSGIIHAIAECVVCGWTCNSKNALGLAAQHHDRTGHCVKVEIGTAVTYGTEPGEAAETETSEA